MEASYNKTRLMKAIKKENAAPKLTGEQIVQKKLDEMNELLRKVDLSKFPERSTTKQD